MDQRPRLFGTEARTRILLGLALLEETFPSELARVIELPLISVQRVLSSLERDGIITSRIVGRNRMISINPRFYGAGELIAFLEKYARRTDIAERAAALRRRPRRTGKAI